MDWSWTPVSLPLLAAAAICLLVGTLGLLRRARGAAAFAVLLAAVSVWSAAYALELLSVPLQQKLFWARVQYLGIVVVPVAWLIFALRYAMWVRRVGFPQIAALMAVPLTTLALLWNPGARPLVWRSAALIEGPGFDLLSLSYGRWFWVHTAYSYALWIAAAAIFMIALRRAPHLYRKQGPAVIMAVFSPYVLNLLYVTGLTRLDLTPFGFVVTGVATFWTLVRQQFLDIMPVARARVFEDMRDGVIVLDPDDRVIDLNRAAAAIVGEISSPLIGSRFDQVFSGRIELRELAGGDNELMLEAMVTGDEEPRCYELRAWPLLDDDDDPCGRLLVFRDVTRQKLVEAALHDSEERLRVLIEQMPAVLWTTDDDLRFTEILGAGLHQLRLTADAVVGMPLADLFGTVDDDHPAIAGHRRALEGFANHYAVEWFGRDFECHVEPLVDAGGAVTGVVGVGLDVTESRSLQEQLRQSQKMEAIGRMAGGVAHDFNNLLTAVAGYAQLANEDLDGVSANGPAVAKLRRDLDAIAHAAERATSITAQLLAFSRRQVLQPRTLDLNATLEEMETMLRRLVGVHIEMLTFLDPGCHPVKIDPVQVQQVVINLVLNARDAMPGGGKITFETNNVDLRDGINVPYDVIPPGRYVLLEVTDNGFGMDERTRARLFEPFFTTKEAGKGTGLGLSTVYGIIRQTGAYIDVDSEIGRGSTFRIYFPAEREGGEAIEKPEIAGKVPVRGSETVLLVEDETMVRELATRVLSSNGYLVLEAETGDEALDLCRHHEGPLDLLVTDVVMPGMNGSELAERFNTLVPQAEVLFISGYTGGALVEHGVLRDGTHFLQKPFSTDQLLRKVREVLNGHSA